MECKIDRSLPRPADKDGESNGRIVQKVIGVEANALFYVSLTIYVGAVFAIWIRFKTKIIFVTYFNV